MVLLLAPADPFQLDGDTMDERGRRNRHDARVRLLGEDRPSVAVKESIRVGLLHGGGIELVRVL